MAQEAGERKDGFYGKRFKGNDGLCNNGILPHYWGFGSDSRGTMTELPNPFAVEIGTHTDDVPEEYDEEKWLLNILVIDTRDVQDKKGCSQCRCDLFDVPSEDLNTIIGIDKKPLTTNYKGGLFCCEEKYRCKLEEGYEEKNRTLSLKYTVSWVDWDQHQVPVKFYVLDVADKVTYNGSEPVHNCLVNDKYLVSIKFQN